MNMLATHTFRPIPPNQIMHIYSYNLSKSSLPFSKLLTSPIHSKFSTLLSSLDYNNADFKVSHTTCRSAPATPQFLEENQETEANEEEQALEKFEWYAQWYPIIHVCDLDESRPLGRRVMGLDVVVWWDEFEKDWKVFEDKCPHRLAPLSQGRIHQYQQHDTSSAHSNFIPQQPNDSTLQDHASKRPSASVYPSCVQNDILWFWPNTDPQCEGIASGKRPHLIPVLADLPASKLNYTRDLPYGYEVLIQNLMDPAHIPYADKEGGKPLQMTVKEININGFKAKLELEGSIGTFSPPCLFYISTNHAKTPICQSNDVSSSHDTQKRYLMIFYCIPVSPGYSRLIVTTRRNFALWLDPVIPLWIFHQELNLVLDSDLYLIHMEERKLMNVGPLNWHKSCYVPTKADAVVVSFRKWLSKYGGGQVQWGAQFRNVLPPTLLREQFFDRYRTHTMNCKSCRIAYRVLKGLEILLQVSSIAVIGMIIAAGNNYMISMAAKRIAVSLAVIFFIASKWLSVLSYRTFCYHDYSHAFRKAHPFSFVIQQLQSFVGL